MYIHSKDDFGPDFWSVMEELAIGYPTRASPEQQASMKTLLEKLALHFPCAECAVHFQAQVAKMPPDSLAGRTPLLTWVIDTHNSVNARTGKPVLDHSTAMKTIGTKYQRRQADAKELEAFREAGTVTPKSSKPGVLYSSAVICFLVACVLVYGVKVCPSRLGKGVAGAGALALILAGTLVLV